ncbi:MAG: DUF2752 domain-containing protein [Acidobacteriota bacterium]|nr:DUF2752 domain-containing protein [Acidobacteriota bacterium]
MATLWLVAAASSFALRPLWIAMAPHLRPCTFKAWTGVPCPTCGTTRAAMSFLSGNLGEAFATNPLATAFGLAFFVGAPLVFLWTFSRLPVPRVSGPLPLWLRVAALSVIGVNWGYLIATL